MKIEIQNIGPLDTASFTLGDLTILCGENNTGKTYATYSLYGFLKTWRSFLRGVFSESFQSDLQKHGVAKIDLSTYLTKAPEIFTAISSSYSLNLHRIFASKQELFRKARFSLTPCVDSVDFSKPFRKEISSGKSVLLVFNKEAGSSVLEVNKLQETGDEVRPRGLFSSVIRNEIGELVFGSLLPRVFIASAERTGAAIFQKELDFARNRMLEALSEREQISPMDLFEKTYSDYALPVKDDVDFIRSLDSTSKNQSELTAGKPDLLEDFEVAVGGSYRMNRDKTLSYITQKDGVKLAMNESSSTVRSLLDLGFYLRHVARVGDMLMIDEPELNLHPKNQRRLARLIARLVNNGIKVFVTTHSDYIVKEINTLIMLGADKQHIQKIREKEGYKVDEVLNIDKVKLYTARPQQKQNKKGKRIKKQKENRFVSAEISQDFGIKAETFDDSIEEMNRIQDSILYGQIEKA